MQPFPDTPQERQKLREEKLEEAYADARLRAARLYGTIRCSEMDNHAGEPGGCRNDGSNCLCECHDLTVRALEVNGL